VGVGRLRVPRRPGGVGARAGGRARRQPAGHDLLDPNPHARAGRSCGRVRLARGDGGLRDRRSLGRARACRGVAAGAGTRGIGTGWRRRGSVRTAVVRGRGETPRGAGRRRDEGRSRGPHRRPRDRGRQRDRAHRGVGATRAERARRGELGRRRSVGARSRRRGGGVQRDGCRGGARRGVAAGRVGPSRPASTSLGRVCTYRRRHARALRNAHLPHRGRAGAGNGRRRRRARRFRAAGQARPSGLVRGGANLAGRNAARRVRGSSAARRGRFGKRPAPARAVRRRGHHHDRVLPPKRRQCARRRSVRRDG
jgi:hypothetical protein